MIIARAPLRVSLAGGGTDLPWFEREHGASLIATTIDKYVTVIVNRRSDHKIRLAYSKDEIVDEPEEIQHPLLREALMGREGIEVHTMADVPANTGLGSSGAFMVALVDALAALDGEKRSAWDVAEEAQRLERRVDTNNGWQDHFIAAFGGTRHFMSAAGSSPSYRCPDTSAPTVHGMESLELWNTGTRREAATVLAQQAETQNVTAMKLLRDLVDDIMRGKHIGDVLDRHHQLKTATAPHAITTGEIEQHAHAARTAGARGVKLIGAGGGGFLLVSMPSEGSFAVRAVLEQRGLRRLDVRFGVPGVEVIRW